MPEKTKEQKIKAEKNRIRKIFAKSDENKLKLVNPLIEKAAFMSVELDELQEIIKNKGCITEYKNGANQYGTKKSAEVDVYISMSKNYANIIKQLMEIVPPAERKNSRLNELRKK